MYDCFISYTQADARFATNLSQLLTSQGLNPFMAKLSLSPGSEWSKRIRDALNSSKWVLFLASQEATSAPAVQQEIGAAIFGGKKLIPIVWNMDPSRLPAWASEYQAVDLREKSAEQVMTQLTDLAQDLRSSKTRGQLIGLAALGALALTLLSSK